MFRVAILLILWGLPLAAGPWPRGAGQQFLSVSLESTLSERHNRHYMSLYHEYGLSDLWTLGIDAGNDLQQTGTSLVFARRHFPNPNRAWLWAGELALGAAYTQTGTAEPVLRPGLSVGRALSFGKMHGWVSVDMFASYFTRRHIWIAKAEGTLGVNLTDRLKLITQATQEQLSDGRRFHSVSAGGAWQLAPDHHLTFALLHYGQDRPMTFKLGYWYAF